MTDQDVSRSWRPTDDGIWTALFLFLVVLICFAASGYLYWYGTGKLPWN
jgi:hypothetical protein